MKNTFPRRRRPRRLARPRCSVAAEGAHRGLRLESLEHRLMLHGESGPEHDLSEHVHHDLSIFIDGEQVPFPAGLGTDATGNILANPHNHGGDERVHVHPIDAALTEFVTVGDFFDVWRTNAGVVGNNPDAFFGSSQILGNFADATHVINMYVNGELNDEFQNYEMHADDDIVIVYSTTAAADSPILDIDDVAVLGGAPLHVALNGFDPDGDALTYSVKSVVTDTGLTETVLEGNRSMQINVADFGSMTFELFEQRAPRVTDAIIGIAQDGTYDGVIFHRVINDFVIQGGDPTGTGTGDPSIPSFDDQFHIDLQHTQTGLLSMAKAGDDSNSSQFFITEGTTRFLDFNHSIFGMLTEGEAVRQAISNVPVGAGDRPITDVVMESVDIFFDETNGVLMLKAPEGASGTAEVTVTVTDEDGNSFDATFTVTVSPDTSNGGPFLNEIPPIQTIAGTPAQFTLTAVDVEGDPVFFDTMWADFDFTLDNDTGEVTITPADGFTGELELFVGVRAVNGSNTNDTHDSQLITITVLAPNAPLNAPLSVDLLASFDTGSADDDDLTNLTVLDFRVEGVTAGAVVTLFSGDTSIGSATATGPSVVVTGNVGTFLGNVHSITATQSLGAVESDLSPALVVTVDRDADGFTTSPPLTANLGDDYLYNVGHDEELVGQQNLAYSLDVAPGGMTIDINTGQIIWLGVVQTAGTHNVVVEATDRAGNVGTQDFTLTVNGPPVLGTIGDKSVDEDEQLLFAVIVDDPNDGDTLTFSLSGDSDAPALGLTSGMFTWTPGELDGGRSFDFTVTVTDAGGLFDSKSFTVTVDEVNLSPQLAAIDDKPAIRGQTLSFFAEGTDPDLPAQVLTYSLVSPPLGASIDPGTGEFSWTPSAEQADAQHTITVRAADSGGLAAERSFTVTVQDVPEPPQLNAIVSPTVNEGDEVELTVTATDPNLPNDKLSFQLISGPDGAAINAETGDFRWQTDEADGPGAFDVTVEVRDLTNLFDLLTFTITVGEVNRNPIFDVQIDDQTVTVGDSLNLDFDASDPDIPEQTLTYSLIDLLEGATINSVTGELNWTPTVDQALQDINVRVRVIDGEGGSDEQTVTVTVEERAKAPVLSPIADRTVDEGEEINLVAQATDPNSEEENLRFSLADGAPDGATIDAVSGEFSWTPGEADGPGEHAVTIVVTDSDSLRDEKTFTITVDEVNQSPVLTPITDRQVMEDQTIAFEAVAGDDDKPVQELRFSLASNAPEGATIDETSGQFHWTPHSGAAGEYLITVRVADDATSSLSDSQSFHVTVEAPPVVLPGFSVAQTLALRSTQSQFFGPVLPVRPTPIVLPVLVNRVQSGVTVAPSLTEAFREFANIGSGGIHARQGTTSGDGPSDKKDAEPGSLKKKPELDEEADIPVDEGTSREAVDEAIARILAETAAAV